MLTPTTVGDQINFGVIYRTAGFSQAKIDGVVAAFLEQIEHPNKASRGELPRRQLAAAANRSALPVATLPRQTVFSKDIAAQKVNVTLLNK